MLIAKIENGAIAQIDDYRSLFPNTSFPVTGPNAQWLSENSCMSVTVFKAHDRATQRLVPAEPYIEDGQVFTVAVQDKTQEELDADLAAANSAKRAANEARAKQELEASDWSELATVRDTNLTPHLTNAVAFDAYRVALRAIVISPPLEVDPWPERPEASWSV